jgi:starvation-inducible DNA-binding protein
VSSPDATSTSTSTGVGPGAATLADGEVRRTHVTRHATSDGVSSDRRASFTVPSLALADADAVIEVLGDRLCSLIDLMLTLKHVHWNVVGPNFIAVHQMLDPQVEQTAMMVDATAERIATMGGSPNGLPGAVVDHRAWNDYSVGRASAQAHLAALDLVYTGVIESHRSAIGVVRDLDPIVEGMLVDQTRQLEEAQWFCRAHLEDSAGGLSHAGTTSELDAAAKASNRERERAR